MKLHPVESWRPMLADLALELWNPPRGPVGNVVDYLELEAEAGQAIVTTYGVPVLRFHTALLPWGGKSCELPDDPTPEWIWIRDSWKSGASARALAWVQETVDLERYEPVILDVPDRRFENREDIHEHVFSGSGPEAPPVRLLRRRSEGS